MKRFLLFSILSICCSTQAQATEQVRIHMDRSLYAAGETIWMRGWITEKDGETPTSKFLYVELLRDGMESVEKRIKIKERNGMFFGQMELPDDLDSGWYTLRAYTKAQKDWPAEALFHTRVLIRGAGSVQILYPMKAAAEESSDIQVNLSPAADGRMTLTLTDTDGNPVPGNFSLSVARDSYADFDYQSSAPAIFGAYPEGEREYQQDMEFRIKSLHRKLPKKYEVTVMSQDIGYYHTEKVAYDKRILTNEGQSFRIPDLDYPDGTLFAVNVIGSMFIFPGEEPDLFAKPFDYGPTYPQQEVLRDTVRISEQLAGTVAPLPADDTLTASKITAEKKRAWYKPERMVGPYSNLFEWRQVRLREDLQKYDDLDLLTYISLNFPSLHIGWGPVGRYLYTTRGASVYGGQGQYHGVAIYIDGMLMEDGWYLVQNYTVRDVQNLYVLRGTEAALYRATAVVLLESRRYDPAFAAEESPASVKTIGIMPLGYQKPKAFDAAPSLNADRQGTYYWNPCIRTDASGHADITLPELPEGCYIRLVGQTLDGRWFSKKMTTSCNAE